MKEVRRIFVQRKAELDIEATNLLKDIKENLLIDSLKDLKIIYRYDIEDIDEETYLKARNTIFSEPPVDMVFDEEITIDKDEKIFAAEFLPGQYDQRADFVSQCLQLLTCKEKPTVRVAKVIIVKGNISDEEFKKIKSYCINPVDSRESALEKPTSLKMEFASPQQIEYLEGFINCNEEELEALRKELGLAMNYDDFKFCQDYLKTKKKEILALQK